MVVINEPWFLPMDVMTHIVAELAVPASQDAYCYEPDAGYLYDRMYLVSMVQVTQIVAVGLPSGAVVRSLWLADESTWQVGIVVNLLIPLAPTLERLAMDKTNIVLFMQFIHVDRSGWYQGPSFMNLPAMRELVLLSHLGNKFPPPMRPVSEGYPCLSRLVIQAAEPPLQEYLQTLEELVIASRWTFPENIEKIIQQNPRLHRVIRIIPPFARDHLSNNRLIAEQVRIATERRGRVTIRDVHPEVELESKRETLRDRFDIWVANHVLVGTIWTLPGMDWATLRA